MGDHEFESPLVGLKTNEESGESESEETLIEEESEESRLEEAKRVLKIFVEQKCCPPYGILNYARDEGLIGFLDESQDTAHLTQHLEVLTEAEKLMEIDDKDGFASFLRDNEEKIRLLPPQGLLDAVCQANAVGCATVLLDSGLELDLDCSFRWPEWQPLYSAVKNLSYGLTNLFLKHGVQARTLNRGSAVDLALDALSDHEYVKHWTTGKSIFKLFYLLCLPELKEGLDTISLLASHAQQDEVEDLCFELIELGKTFKLTALLWAAREKLLVSSEGGLESTPVGKYILRKLRHESEREMSCLQSTNLLLKPEFDRRATLMAAYHLVKVLWTSINVLDRYRQSDRVKTIPKQEVPFDIARDLINETELFLKPSDVFCADIQCLQPEVNGCYEARERAKQLCYKKLEANQKRHPHLPLNGADWNPAVSLSWFASTSKKPSSSFHAVRGINYSINKPFSTLSMSSCLSLRFHTTSFRAINYNFNKPVVNQLCKTAQLKQSLPNALASTARARGWAPLIWVAKRSIR